MIDHWFIILLLSVALFYGNSYEMDIFVNINMGNLYFNNYINCEHTININLIEILENFEFY